MHYTTILLYTERYRRGQSLPHDLSLVTHSQYHSSGACLHCSVCSDQFCGIFLYNLNFLCFSEAGRIGDFVDKYVILADSLFNLLEHAMEEEDDYTVKRAHDLLSQYILCAMTVS